MPFRFGVAISPGVTTFGPLLFAGRLAEGFEQAARAGFDAVELSLRRVEDVDLETLRSLAREHRLAITAIATGQAFLHDGLSLSAPTAPVREATVAHLEKLIQLAAQLNAAVILGGIRGRLGGTEAEKREQRAGAVEAIRECARYASSQRVRLLLEPINRYETNFINTAAEALSLMDEVGDPGIKLLMDAFHMNIEEADMCETLRRLGARLGYFHVADSNRHAPGWGHTDFPGLFHALEEAGYEGLVSAEILPVPDDLRAMEQAGRYLNTLAGRS